MSNERPGSTGCRRVTTDEHLVIERMVLNGESYAEIGRQLSRQPNTVRRYALRIGLMQSKQYREQRVIELYRRPDVPMTDICLICHISVPTLYKILRLHSVPLRKPWISERVRRGRQMAQEIQP